MPASSRAIRAGRAYVEFSLADGQFSKDLRRVEKRLRAMGSTLQRFGRAGLALGAGLAAPFAIAIKAASDSQETLSKFNTVFGDLTDSSLTWSNQFADDVGRSQGAVQGFLAGLQDLFVPLGFAGDKAAELSKQVAALGIDLASFNNTTDEAALRDLQAALTGSGEVMKKYGVIVSEAAVKQELLNQGLDPKTVTQQQKVMARLNIIMAGTTAAQGDALRTAAGFANQTKRLRGGLVDLASNIGDSILPTVAALAAKLGDAVRWARDWAAANHGLFQALAAVAAGVVAAGAALFAIGTAFQVAAFAAGGLATAIGLVGSVVGVIVSPIGLTVAAIAGLTAWFITATETGQALADKLGAAFGELKDIALKSFRAISAALAAGDITAAGEILWASLRLLWLQGTADLRARWHEMIGAIVRIWFNSWASLQTTWTQTLGGLADLWDVFVGGIRKAWASTVAFFQRTWLRVKGLFGVDVAGEIAKINAELERTNANIDRRTSANLVRRGQQERNRLGNIQAELQGRLGATDSGTAAAIAAAQKELDKARDAWGEATKAAEAAGAAAEAQQQAAKETGNALAANAATGAGKFASLGTFNGAALLSLIGGRDESLNERTANATERTAKAAEKIAKAGGPVFGA